MGRTIVEGETFDRTALTATSHGYAVHRDYAAHFFRWGFALRHVTTSTRLLDVACGVDTPLCRALSMRHVRPATYLGVDLNALPRAPSRQWATFKEKFDFTRRFKELSGNFDLITCFEAYEHMPAAAGLRLLKGIKHCLADGGVALVSTPVIRHDGHMAKNHINEVSIETLSGEIKKAGLKVVQRYGTFASYHDLKKVAPAHERKLLDELRNYYDGEVVACFLAPKYPDASRNNIWVLTK